ncbi:MAG: hypothetical protein IME92_06555 [Proteobacteria bacterium]|nr:hypothetical protein [Pseudomonadota bacterium]
MIKIIGDLAVSFLNATLMLVIILTVSAIILVGKVQDLSNNTLHIVQNALAPQVRQLETIATGIESFSANIQARPGAGTCGVGLVVLNKEIAELKTQVQSVHQVIIQEEPITAAILAKQVVKVLVAQMEQVH